MRIDDTDLRIVYEVSYESFLAGALLMLPSVDSYDKKALCKELSLTLSGYNDTRKIDQYINKDANGTVSLKEGFTLDSNLEEGCTIRAKLREIAGDEVLRHSQTFKVKRYLYNKQQVLEAKKEIVDKAGVLLITENEEIYNELKKYGFKNVDYFKSMIRADKYFKEHPEELKKYHIILKGRLSTRSCVSDRDVDLDKTLHELRNKSLRDKSNVIIEDIYESYYGDRIEYSVCVSRKTGVYSFSSQISHVIGDIVDLMYSSGTLGKCGYQSEFKPIVDIVADRLPLPTKKGDLKILFLYNLGTAYIEKIKLLVNNMGLNVTFIENNNTTLGKIVKYQLGEYDIIVSITPCSEGLIYMGAESTEQCKDTGRELTLLVTSDSVRSGGSFVENEYVYGGNLAPKTISEQDTTDKFRISLDNLTGELKEFAVISAILSAVVNKYNKCLPTPLIDLDLKSSEEYTKAYELMCEQRRVQEINDRNAISAFDDMVEIIGKYLECRRNGLIERNPRGKEIIEKEDGLRLIQLGNGIKLENYRHGEMNFAIAFPLMQKNKDCRVFSMKTKDSDFKSASLCVGKQEGSNIPPKVSDYQLKVLTAFEELVSKTLLLLPLEAQKKLSSSKK